MTTQLTQGSDGNYRCSWCFSAPDFLQYHDNEWGYPVDNDFRLFEKLCLEGFQAGLSWRTILSKRENFREAFHDFNFNKVAHFNRKSIEQLITNKGIVRHRGKIEAVINNAKCAKEIVKSEGSLASFVWKYEPEDKVLAKPQSKSTSSESIALSKDLKKLGWKFVGPTTVYAFMQAMGLVNDHLEGCITRSKIQRARSNFIIP
ncbi:DNA-3-methyladenine glycosylase I [Microbulbifer sp. VAAF005]|uniref:DNA-3-methyladenine glycosylase I n=1 Tax=Microbulbifer sp. VAAF005 TaxID=3034230 RepID=UPI0024ADFD5A|nr:DNA-3-methyladenine glycosylase I [Microbulbifer sp. VAAF005]WHI46454.1 DNA-3-methyladenine glycosylase I [Microbulbifer sp. VAAF005]